MKRALRMALVVFVFYILQTSVFTTLRIASIQPDMMAVMLACICVHTGTYGGFCAGCVSGLLLDTFVGHVMGLYVVLYPLMGYGVAKIRRPLENVVGKVFKGRFQSWRRYVTNILCCILMVALREVIFVTYMFLNGVEVTYLHVLRVVTCLVYSAFMTIPSDWLITRLLCGKKKKVVDADAQG